jgi:membrane protease YdiL (CAAX protease family)
MPDPQPRNSVPPSPGGWPSPQPPALAGDPLFGRFGLRAVWGILLFCLLYTLFTAIIPTRTETLLAAFHAVMHHVSAPAQPTDLAAAVFELHAPVYLIYESLLFAFLALSAWLLARIEHRPIAVYGIAARRFGDVLAGAFWGLATMSLLIATLRASHLLVFDSRTLSGPAVLTSGTLWLITFLAVGLAEEYLYRGYLQFTLTRGLFGLAERLAPRRARPLAFWAAAILMSAGFGLRHLLNRGETAPGILAVSLAGIVFSYALWRTGSLWWAIGFHMTWDWAQSFLYGVPDSGLLSAGRLFHTHPAGNPLLSGGLDGPEGSLLVLPIFLLVVLILRFTTRPGDQPALEPEIASPAQSRTPGSAIA